MELARELNGKGYKVIPVGADGRPCFSGIYENVSFHESDIESWQYAYPTAYTAIVNGYNDVVTIDCDISNKPLSAAIFKAIEAEFEGGNYVVRRRNKSNRFAIICRADDTLRKAIRNAASTAYRDPETNEKQRMEYLAWHKYIIVEGPHRKDPESVYRIKGEFYKVDDLVRISIGQLRKIFRLVDQLSPENWLPVEKGYEAVARTEDEGASTPVPIPRTSGLLNNLFAGSASVAGNNGLRDRHEEEDLPANPRDALRHVAPKRVPYTEEEIDYILDNTDGTTREQWLNVGLALHVHYGGSQEGLERWTTWAEQFDGYKGVGDQKYHWGTFKEYKDMTLEVLERRIGKKLKQDETSKAEPNGDPGLLALDAFRPEKKDNAFDWMMNNYVLISQGGFIGDLSKPVAESLRTIQQLRDFNKGRKMIVKTLDRKGTVVPKTVAVFDRWLETEDHLEAWGTEYAPGAGRLIPAGWFKGRDEIYYNTYNPPLLRKIPRERVSEDAVAIFRNHLAYLFPEDRGRWMLNWMAQLVQEPHKRYRVSPFSISIFEGTGRGWLTELLSRLVGISNYATVKDITDIIRPGAKSGYLDGTVLLVVNEVYVQGKERFGLLSQLKTLLSDDVQEVDVKYGAHTHNQHIYTRVFFQSNHIDGLVIDDSDSRIQPFINREGPKERAYYDVLYESLEKDEFMESVYAHLWSIPVDYARLKHSRSTGDRDTVIRGAKSPTALAFYEFKHVVGNNCFTDDMLSSFVCEHLGLVSGETGLPNTSELNFLKKTLSQRARPVLLARNRQPSAVKCFADQSKLDTDDLRRSVEKSKELIEKFFTERGSNYGTED